jgi:Fur family ferric uptake transcriptional regulator
VVQIEQRLRDEGVRATRARVAVFEALERAGRHATVDDLALAIGGGVNVASIYRSLALFEDLGLAQRTAGHGDATAWELRHADDEIHLVCTTCGAVAHHPVGEAADLIAHVREDHGFEVSRASVTMEGRCRTCLEA